MNFSTLTFKRIIAHDIKRSEESIPSYIPFCSDEVISIEGLGEDLKTTLRNKIMDLKKNSVIMDAQEDGQILSIAQKISGMDDNVFVSESKRSAQKLANDQASSTNVPDGILLVIHAQNSTNENILIFIKAEYIKGVQKKDNDSGNPMLKLVDDIILASGKLNKMGAFFQEEEKWMCVLHDDNMTKTDKTKAAKYFFESFLELKYREDDKYLTRKFFDLTREFIDKNYRGDDNVTKHNELITYLQAEGAQVIKYSEFASNYMPSKKDEYEKFLINKNFPERAVPRNLEFIRDRFLKFRTLSFRRNIKITLPLSEYKESFHLLNKQEMKDMLNQDEQKNISEENDQKTFICINSPVIKTE